MAYINPNISLRRRDFIRITAAGSAGLILSACGVENAGKIVNKDDSDSLPLKTDSVSSKKQEQPKGPVNSANVTYFKKGVGRYDELRKGHNKRIDKYPALIALCMNAAGVQEAVNYARIANMPVAIKSGGHSLEGFSCNNDGMVINMSEMNSIEWLNEDTVKVGPGCTLSKLYDELLPKSRQIPAGSCGGVGIAGLTLGGGYGMFSRKFGLTCDSLTGVKMIDASGAERNSMTDPDLLWACRGGGAGNFGVVTELTFKTHKAVPHLIAHRFRKFNCKPQEAAYRLEKWFELSRALPEHCFSGYVLNGKTVFILLTVAGEESPEVKKMFDELSLLSDKISKGEPKDLAESLKAFYGIQHPVNYKNSSVGFYNGYTDVEHFILKVMESVQATPGMIYAVNTLGGKIKDAEAEKNAAFAHRKFDFLSELQTYWKEDKNKQRMLDAFAVTRNVFIENGINAEYVNYPDLEFPDWEKAYYGNNYEKLQQIKKRYDPYDLVRHEQSVKPPEM